MVLYFDRNLETLKTILSCAEKAAKIRKTEERAKTNLLTKQKYSFDSNGKLANCEKKDPCQCGDQDHDQCIRMWILRRIRK